MLGYLPEERQGWEEHLKSRRDTYKEFVRELGAVDPFRSADQKQPETDWETVGELDDPLSSARGNKWEEHFQDQSQRDEIHKDVYRTQSSMNFFKQTVSETSTSNEYKKIVTEQVKLRHLRIEKERLSLQRKQKRELKPRPRVKKVDKTLVLEQLLEGEMLNDSDRLSFKTHDSSLFEETRNGFVTRDSKSQISTSHEILKPSGNIAGELDLSLLQPVERSLPQPVEPSLPQPVNPSLSQPVDPSLPRFIDPSLAQTHGEETENHISCHNQQNGSGGSGQVKPSSKLEQDSEDSYTQPGDPEESLQPGQLQSEDILRVSDTEVHALERNHEPDPVQHRPEVDEPAQSGSGSESDANGSDSESDDPDEDLPPQFDSQLSLELENDLLRSQEMDSDAEPESEVGSAGAQNLDPDDHSQVMARILFLYSKLNPGIKYVQGMNELLAILYFVNANDRDSDTADNAEADTFFLFTTLMGEVRDRFIQTMDDARTGILAVIERYNLMVKLIDPPLYHDMMKKEVDARFYVLRWLSLLLTQEFALPDVLRLWDSFLADEERFQFLDFCCVAMLTTIRDSLLAGSFAENLKLLQQYPPIDVYQILRPAIQMRVEYRIQVRNLDLMQQKRPRLEDLEREMQREMSWK